MRILLLALLPLIGGCLNITWQRESRFAPPPEEAVARLQPDESSLGHCLNALGAPLWVWEYRGDGVGLAYGWLETESSGFNLSAPVTDYVAVSLDYDEVDSEMHGLVLLFDEDLNLTELRRGLLRDLTTKARRTRPGTVE